MTGTPSLKALARRVLERDNQQDMGRDSSPSSVPLSRNMARGTGGTLALRSPEARPSQASPVPAPGPGARAELWRDWYEERCAIRQYEAGYPRRMAEALAYREAINRWHRLNGAPTDPALCAGCGGLLSGGEILDLPDSARVHIDDEWACLRVYRKRWCNEAVTALAGLNVHPPEGWEL